MSIQSGGIITKGENQSTQGKAYSHANLSATNCTQISVGLTLSLHPEKPVANYLSHGMALGATLFAGNER
jgi:hypothetical protein